MKKTDFLFVQFHSFEPDTGNTEEMFGEGAATGTHFQQLGKGMLPQCIYDLTAYVFVAEEMLTERFFQRVHPANVESKQLLPKIKNGCLQTRLRQPFYNTRNNLTDITAFVNRAVVKLHCP
jgi:hypothetical protein